MSNEKLSTIDKIELTLRTGMVARDVLALMGVTDYVLAKITLNQAANTIVDLIKWMDEIESNHK